MQNRQIWKRVGGWFGKTSTAEVSPNSELSRDGNVISFGTETKVVKQDTKARLEKIEDNFNRMVDVLSSINDTVVVQKEYSEILQKSLSQLPEVLKMYPETVAHHNEIVNTLTTHLTDQAEGHEKLLTTIETLPSHAMQQMDKLVDINHRLERASEQHQMVLENAQAQSLSMANIGELLQSSDDRMNEMLSAQQKRFTFLFGLSIFSIITLAGALITLGILYFKGN